MAKVEYTSATLAAELETTPKELRKFLRSELSGVEKVGKGGRYTIPLTATQLAKTKKNFIKWGEEAQAKRDAAATISGPTEETENEALALIDGTDEVITEEIDADDEPTDEDIEALELEEIDEA